MVGREISEPSTVVKKRPSFTTSRSLHFKPWILWMKQATHAGQDGAGRGLIGLDHQWFFGWPKKWGWPGWPDFKAFADFFLGGGSNAKCRHFATKTDNYNWKCVNQNLPTHTGEHSHFNRLPLPMWRVHLKGCAHHLTQKEQDSIDLQYPCTTWHEESDDGR